jgi:hypothetical protein
LETGAGVDVSSGALMAGRGVLKFSGSARPVGAGARQKTLLIRYPDAVDFRVCQRNEQFQTRRVLHYRHQWFRYVGGHGLLPKGRDNGDAMVSWSSSSPKVNSPIIPRREFTSLRRGFLCRVGEL